MDRQRGPEALVEQVDRAARGRSSGKDQHPPLTVIAAVPPAPGAANDPGRVRSYEELDGAEGRGVFFRPHRYTAAALAPLQATVSVAVSGKLRLCPLRDVSQNGIAFFWPAQLPVEVRQRLDVALRFDEHEAFRGEAVVGSVREQDGAVVVGASFHEFLLDVDEIVQLKAVRAWSFAAAPLARRAAWAVPGCTRYKSAIAEMRLFFQDAQQQCAALEPELPWHVLHGKENAARAALVSELRADFVPQAVRLSEEVDAAVRELPGAHRDPAAKEWSRRHVDEFLLQAPGCARARGKPFGYPGDYEVMNFIYERPFEGPTLFARAVELAFWHSRSALAVRARKDLVKRELESLVARSAGSGRPVRVLSIAAGPAQEIAELFEGADSLSAPIEIVLFEQDKNALAHAWRRLAPLLARFGPSVRLTYLHASIKRLLRDPELLAPFGEFDLVYSAGLLDYLQHRTAVTLARRLAAVTAPGDGKLLVANMVDHRARWFLEVPLEWPLVYRTREELLDLGERAVPGARLRIVDEDSGVNPFLEIVRHR
jgi:extracellular factor (EF) 3-hydroxypalmitic acid methyl ester biosynthesis protein